MISGLPVLRIIGGVTLAAFFVFAVRLQEARAQSAGARENLKIGSRVRISQSYHWAQGAVGTVTMPPKRVLQLGADFEGYSRIVHGAKGPRTFYWVTFDRPQKDTEDSGPYFGAEIDAAALSQDASPPVKVVQPSDVEIQAVWYENKKLKLKVEYKAYVEKIDSTPWPPLPTHGFIRGRPATNADVDSGDAIFSAQIAGRVIGKPLDIVIPQYVEWRDKVGIKRAILVQAESANGQAMVGLRLIATGAAVAATLPELKLLGTKPQ